MKIYGLVGHPLSHSFSQKYFRDKFERLGLKDCDYKLFDLESIAEISALIAFKSDLEGFNVTIPYKETIIPYLSHLDKSAELVGAVNVVKRVNKDNWVGYNSDYYGFKESLEKWLPDMKFKALILGTGGASKAIRAVLKQLSIEYKLISRCEDKTDLTYNSLKTNELLIKEHQLIVNTTPLGMHPNVNQFPDIDYNQLTAQHFLYDLVYNPEETMFLKKGKKLGSQVKNGLEMLRLQAEKSWEIWNTSN